MPTIYKPKKERIYSDGKRKERQRIYQTDRWKRLRLVKLSENPICEICENNGVITPAVDVHHKVSFMTTDDKVKRHKLAFDIRNLLSLCRDCHLYEHNVISKEETPWGRKDNK